MKDEGWRVMMGRDEAEEEMEAMANALHVCNRNSKGLNSQGV
jgi:hypothetical protein